MKTLRIIIALFALLVALKGGKVIIFPGDNLMIIEDVRYKDETVSCGVIYDKDDNMVQRIPMDLIMGMGAINDKLTEPETEI